MALHRWGEGMTARWIAFAILAMFALWGPASGYWWHQGYSTVVERDSVLLAEDWDRTIAYRRDGGPERLDVRGLTAQPLTDELKDRPVLVDIRVKGGGVLVRSGERLTDAQIKAVRNAGFTALPIKDEGKQAVEERIIGVCVTGELVANARTVPQHVRGRKDGKPGEIVTEENRTDIERRLTEATAPIPQRAEGQWVTVYRTDADGKEELVELKGIDLLQVGDEFAVDVPGLVTDEIAPPDTLIDRTVYDKLKAAGIARVRVKENAVLPVTPETKSALTGWYVTSNDQLEQPTWWTTELFAIPILDVGVDWGTLVCAVLALALVATAWWHLNKPHVAESLIDTQAEMKKVSWPSSRELVGSSVVVIAFILVIGVFLAASDWVFSAVAIWGGIFPRPI